MNSATVYVSFFSRLIRVTLTSLGTVIVRDGKRRWMPQNTLFMVLVLQVCQGR
jgi:hypothetical protein